jgi:hypothetical protein
MDDNIANRIKQAWKALPQSEKRRSIMGGVLIVWASFLIADMYMLQQDPRFQEKFGKK